MQRRSRFARLVLGPLAAALTTVLVSALSVSACSNQGEGERCSHLGDNAGDDECQDGLKCLPRGSDNTQSENYRCCPQDTTTPTVAACKTGQVGNPVPQSPVPTADASAADTGVTEASTDSSLGDASDANATMDALVSDAGDGGG